MEISSDSSWIHKVKAGLPRFSINLSASHRHVQRLLSPTRESEAFAVETELQRPPAELATAGATNDIVAGLVNPGPQESQPSVNRALSMLGNFTSILRSSNHRFQRLLSSDGGSGNEAAAPGRRPATEAAPGDLEAGLVNGGERPQTNEPAAAAADNSSRSIPELVIPLGLCLTIYVKIPDVQLHGHGVLLAAYYSLHGFLVLGMGSSLYIIFYALAKSGEDVKSAKNRWMKISMVFFLMAFTSFSIITLVR